MYLNPTHMVFTIGPAPRSGRCPGTSTRRGTEDERADETAGCIGMSTRRNVAAARNAGSDALLAPQGARKHWTMAVGATSMQTRVFAPVCPHPLL